MKKCQIQKCIHIDRISLKYFVSQNVGFEHISHDDFVEKHTTPIAKKLFCDDKDKSAILVLDAIWYMYINLYPEKLRLQVSTPVLQSS